DPGPTPGDVTAAEIAESLQMGWLTSVAKAVSALGSLWVVLPLAAICAGLLAAGRRWAELAVLVAGMALTILGVHEIQYTVGRPAPPRRRLPAPPRPPRPSTCGWR